MRIALLIFGVVCIAIGLQFLIVDKVVLHQFGSRPARASDRDPDEPAPPPELIDLPDSGGYVLVAIGTACVLYYLALGRKVHG